MIAARLTTAARALASGPLVRGVLLILFVVAVLAAQHLLPILFLRSCSSEPIEWHRQSGP